MFYFRYSLFILSFIFRFSLFISKSSNQPTEKNWLQECQEKTIYRQSFDLLNSNLSFDANLYSCTELSEPLVFASRTIVPILMNDPKVVSNVFLLLSNSNSFLTFESKNDNRILFKFSEKYAQFQSNFLNLFQALSLNSTDDIVYSILSESQTFTELINNQLVQSELIVFWKLYPSEFRLTDTMFIENNFGRANANLEKMGSRLLNTFDSWIKLHQQNLCDFGKRMHTALFNFMFNSLEQKIPLIHAKINQEGHPGLIDYLQNRHHVSLQFSSFCSLARSTFKNLSLSEYSKYINSKINPSTYINVDDKMIENQYKTAMETQWKDHIMYMLYVVPIESNVINIGMLALMISFVNFCTLRPVTTNDWKNLIQSAMIHEYIHTIESGYSYDYLKHLIPSDIHYSLVDHVFHIEMERIDSMTFEILREGFAQYITNMLVDSNTFELLVMLYDFPSYAKGFELMSNLKWSIADILNIVFVQCHYPTEYELNNIEIYKKRVDSLIKDGKNMNHIQDRINHIIIPKRTGFLKLFSDYFSITTISITILVLILIYYLFKSIFPCSVQNKNQKNHSNLSKVNDRNKKKKVKKN